MIMAIKMSVLWPMVFLGSTFLFAVQTVLLLDRKVVSIGSSHVEFHPSFMPSSSILRTRSRKQQHLLSSQRQTLISSAGTDVDSAGTEANVTQLASCLLVKDDNALLNEWLAYHYHVWNLKHIVLAVDPTSETKPQLEAWNRFLPDLQITIWHDRDYMDQAFLEQRRVPPRFFQHNTTSRPVATHRYRQLSFLGACLREFRKQQHKHDNNRVVIHIDTDEYLTLHPKLQVPVDDWSQPGAYVRIWNQLLQRPNLAESANWDGGCVSLPRVLYVGPQTQPKEHEDDSPNYKAKVGNRHFQVNASSLETLRWTQHAAFSDTVRNAQPKVMVQVDRFFADTTDKTAWGNRRNLPFSIHRPSASRCRRVGQLDDGIWAEQPWKFPLVVRHYLGTYERYMERKDARRSLEAYNKKANITNTDDRSSLLSDDVDDNWRQWANGFAQHVGPAATMALWPDHVVVAP